MKPSISKQTSSVISALRFPLSLLVLFVHASLRIVPSVSPQAMPLSSTLSFVLSDVVASLAVPSFFLISGYLFFNGGAQFGLDAYKKKLSARGHNLFKPYLAWNTVYLLLVAVIQFLMPHFVNGNNKAVADYGLADYFFSYVSMDYVNNGFSFSTFVLGPVDLPLWYVRDLLLIALFSPLFYWLLTKLKAVFLFLLLGLWLSGVAPHLLCINTSSIFFFCLGAGFMLRGADLVESVKPYGLYFTAVYVAIVAALVILRPENEMLKNVSLIFGVTAVIYLASLAVSRCNFQPAAILTQSSFFLYASHYYAVIASMRIAGKVLAGHDLLMVAAYLILPLAIGAAIVGVYALLRKFTPSLLAVFTGGR